MAISMKSVKCPECGASLPVEEGRTQVFCSYCGASVIISNENEHIYRHIDEAGIKKAETDRIVRLRQLEIFEKSSVSIKAITVLWLFVTLALLITGVVLLILNKGNTTLVGLLLVELTVFVAVWGKKFVLTELPARENDKALLGNGGIRFPKNLESIGKNYEVVKQSLFNCGFTNISCVNMHDLTIGLFQKPGSVAAITVDGEEITSGGRVYMPDAPIIISYHGK